jgi:hypothetical protein
MVETGVFEAPRVRREFQQRASAIDRFVQHFVSAKLEEFA